MKINTSKILNDPDAKNDLSEFQNSCYYSSWAGDIVKQSSGGVL